MERRQFLKQIFRTGNSNVLKWALAVVAIYAFFKVDFNTSTGNFLSVAKLVGVLLAVMVVCFLGLSLIALLCGKLVEVLPRGVLNWIAKNGPALGFVLYLLLAGMILYYSIERNDYLIPVVLLVSSLFPYFKKWRARRRGMSTLK